MDIEWRRFDDGTLQGMETFIGDDFSACVIKYTNGEGFHWLIRSWDEDNVCTVTGSYDFFGTQDGWEFLSDAYRNLLSHMTALGIITAAEESRENAPSAIRSFLAKAASLGLVAVVSLSALSGIMSPVLAYADDAAPNSGDVYVEMKDGVVGIYNTNDFQSRDTVNYLDYDSGNFVEIEPGTDFYNTIVNAAKSGFSEETKSNKGVVGHISGCDGVSIIIQKPASSAPEVRWK